MDRADRKIIVENGGKHPASLTTLLYLPREKGGRGLRSVEHEYKITKIKSLLKLYQNPDQTVEAVREFEEHAMASGHQSLVKEAAKYAEDLNITLQLDTLNPVCVATEGKVVTAARAGNLLKILFFELLREHGLIEEAPPWYSPVMPKSAYQNTTSEAFWDIPIFAEHNEAS